MKILKKNQLAIMVVSLMLITAGYLSYGSNLNVETTSRLDGSQTGINVADIGDAELVNANLTEEEKKDTNEVRNAENPEQNQVQNVIKQEKMVNAPTSSTNDEYFTSSKLERNVMYSQMTSRYQEIIASSSASPEQKNIARRRNK
ncbi:MAG: SpoIIIAH-like family protein [Clostridia bacterium]|jgi:hypothetical protein|nr:SpoIIIAH-like family protein [Clostridia bacterium]